MNVLIFSASNITNKTDIKYEEVRHCQSIALSDSDGNGPTLMTCYTGDYSESMAVLR